VFHDLWAPDHAHHCPDNQSNDCGCYAKQRQSNNAPHSAGGTWLRCCHRVEFRRSGQARSSAIPLVHE
jgi:hypothetical protein